MPATLKVGRRCDPQEVEITGGTVGAAYPKDSILISAWRWVRALPASSYLIPCELSITSPLVRQQAEQMIFQQGVRQTPYLKSGLWQERKMDTNRQK